MLWEQPKKRQKDKKTKQNKTKNKTQLDLSIYINPILKIHFYKRINIQAYKPYKKM